MLSNSQIIAGLAQIATLLRADGRRGADAAGVTSTQAQILIRLVRRGPARVTAVAEQLAVTQPTATEAVSALLRKGLVRKRPDPADARASLLHATAKGRKLAQRVDAWPDALLAAFDQVDPAETAAFLRTLTAVIRSLQLDGAVPVQRMCATCRFFRPNVYPDPAAPHHCEFVDAAFGDAQLRLDCDDHDSASKAAADDAWSRFTAPNAVKTDASPAPTSEAP